MSSRNIDSAVSRCVSPRSSRAQSGAVTMRGTRQNGKIFSVPRSSAYTENVTPWLSRASSASACALAKSLAERPSSASNARATSGRGRPFA
jgi:hypothetical protein